MWQHVKLSDVNYSIKILLLGVFGICLILLLSRIVEIFIIIVDDVAVVLVSVVVVSVVVVVSLSRIVFKF